MLCFCSSDRGGPWQHTSKVPTTVVFGPILIGFLVDVAVIYLVLVIFFPQTPWPLAWSIGLRVMLEVAASLYGLYVFAKRFLWFQLFERKGRVEQTAREFIQAGFPEPEPYYNDADEYLTRAAKDKAVNKEARFQAAFLLGVLFSQRQFGPRREGFITTLVVENALKLMPVRQDIEGEADGRS